MLPNEGDFVQDKKSFTYHLFISYLRNLCIIIYIYINYISFLKQDIGNFSLENLDKKFLIQEIIS